MDEIPATLGVIPVYDDGRDALDVWIEDSPAGQAFRQKYDLSPSQLRADLLALEERGLAAFQYEIVGHNQHCFSVVFFEPHAHFTTDGNHRGQP